MSKRLSSVWLVLVGVLLVCCLPAHAEPFESPIREGTRVFHLETQQEKAIATTLDTLAKADVVYLGETHDNPLDHQAQTEIIRAIYQKRPNLVIAMEMFQRPFQPVVDRYLAETISEQDLLQQSEYAKRWGFDWEFYAPIVRFAQEKKLAIAAINTPTEITRKVARTGLDSLTAAEKQWIPPKSDIFLGPPAYQQRIRHIYDTMHQGKGSSANFDRFFLAQVLWDETMADGIVNARNAHPTALIIVLAGQGHIAYGDGIPSRVARRMRTQQKSLRQLSVMLNPSEEDKKGDRAISDYFWYSPSASEDSVQTLN